MMESLRTIDITEKVDSIEMDIVVTRTIGKMVFFGTGTVYDDKGILLKNGDNWIHEYLQVSGGYL